jgi:hypothetical protein
VPVLSLLKRLPSVRRNPECSLLCGGTTSPSSPPFPLRGRGRAKRRKDAGHCHLCHCHCHCQTLNAVAVQKTGAYAGITWQTSSAAAILFMQPECGPWTGRTAAFCTQAGRPILLQGCKVAMHHGCVRVWVDSSGSALLPCLQACGVAFPAWTLEWRGHGPLGRYSCGF